MRTKIEAVLTPIWLLALSILVTIYLAWGFYYFDIDWMHLLNYVILGKTELWHNFNILMQYLTFPWVGHLAMPDFPSFGTGACYSTSLSSSHLSLAKCEERDLWSFR